MSGQRSAAEIIGIFLFGFVIVWKGLFLSSFSFFLVLCMCIILCVCAWMYVCMYVCMYCVCVAMKWAYKCACVCVRERERERERANACACTCVRACARILFYEALRKLAGLSIWEYNLIIQSSDILVCYVDISKPSVPKIKLGRSSANSENLLPSNFYKEMNGILTCGCG